MSYGNWVNDAGEVAGQSAIPGGPLADERNLTQLYPGQQLCSEKRSECASVALGSAWNSECHDMQKMSLLRLAAPIRPEAPPKIDIRYEV